MALCGEKVKKLQSSFLSSAQVYRACRDLVSGKTANSELGRDRGLLEIQVILASS
jgi:hypothetical protein